MSELFEGLANTFPAATILVVVVFGFVITYAVFEGLCLAVKWVWRKIREMV